MKPRFAALLIAATLAGSLATSPASGLAGAAAAGVVAPEGWVFQPRDDKAILPTIPDHLGSLREVKTPSEFLTVPIIVELKKGLSQRSASAQLASLEAEVKQFMKREKNKPSYFSKKILEKHPVVEAEYGSPGKGFTWVHSSVHGDRIVILVAVSRAVRPPAHAREEFYAMARSLVLPD